MLNQLARIEISSDDDEESVPALESVWVEATDVEGDTSSSEVITGQILREILTEPSRTDASLNSFRETETLTDRAGAESGRTIPTPSEEVPPPNTEPRTIPHPNLLLITWEDLECKICRQFPHPPTHIYMCQNGHNQCGDCMNKNYRLNDITTCPTCRNNAWARNHFYEDMIEKYINA